MRQPQSYLDRVIAALRRLHLHAVKSEYEVQKAVYDVLADARLHPLKEFPLAPRCRVDFLCDGGIAVEVKRGKPHTGRVAAQVGRYCSSSRVTALVLVTERGLVHTIDEAHGKPVRTVTLSENWGVAT